MEGEILNIHYHWAILMTKALNKAPHKKAAAELLGISPKILRGKLTEKYVLYDYLTQIYHVNYEKFKDIKIIITEDEQ